jgi:hypothetical protein
MINLYINRQTQIFYSFFLSFWASQEKFAYNVRKVSCRFAETHYNLHQPAGLHPKDLQSFNVNLIGNFNDFALTPAAKTNTSTTPRTDVLRRTAHFVNQCSHIFIRAISKTKPK